MTVPIPTVYATEPPTQIEPGTGWVRRTNLYANDPMAPENYGPVKVEGNWQRIGVPRSAEPDPMEQVGRFAQQAYRTMPAQEAEAAVAAAIQFQGLRGYNRDMQAGKTANEAIAKWGPAMFYRSPKDLATVLKANQAPGLTPYQQANLEIAKRRLALSEAAANEDAMPTEFARDPNKEYITRGGALIPRVKPDATAVQTVTETIPAQEAVPAVAAKPRPTILGIPIPFTKGTEATPSIPGHGEMRIKRVVPAGQSLAEAAAASAPEQEKPLDKATASLLLKQAGGDKAKARELAKKAGYTF